MSTLARLEGPRPGWTDRQVEEWYIARGIQPPPPPPPGAPNYSRRRERERAKRDRQRRARGVPTELAPSGAGEHAPDGSYRFVGEQAVPADLATAQRAGAQLLNDTRDNVAAAAGAAGLGILGTAALGAAGYFLFIRMST